ncbi:MAG: hypothetical protein ACREC9_09770 [Methylocella sp.]
MLMELYVFQQEVLVIIICIALFAASTVVANLGPQNPDPISGQSAPARHAPHELPATQYLQALEYPDRFNFVRLSDHVFVEAGMSVVRRAKLALAIHDGERKVIRFYGYLKETPRILVCDTGLCMRRLEVPECTSFAVGTAGIVISPHHIDATFIAHERSHIELRGRLGAGKIPAWFNEGLAVIVSHPAQTYGPGGLGDRCLAEPKVDFPPNETEWARAISFDVSRYARTACRVQRWMDANGGNDGALALIAKVAKGVAFSNVYHDPD